MDLEKKTVLPVNPFDEAHQCCVEHCFKMGAMGFARNHHAVTQWWCHEHYPFKNSPAVNTVVLN